MPLHYPTESMSSVSCEQNWMRELTWLKFWNAGNHGYQFYQFYIMFLFRIKVHQLLTTDIHVKRGMRVLSLWQLVNVHLTLTHHIIIIHEGKHTQNRRAFSVRISLLANAQTRAVRIVKTEILLAHSYNTKHVRTLQISTSHEMLGLKWYYCMSQPVKFVKTRAQAYEIRSPLSDAYTHITLSLTFMHFLRKIERPCDI